MAHGFLRDAEPYPDDAGVALRMLVMPVSRPAAGQAPRRAERQRQRRRSPGDPSCGRCAESGSGYCEAHREYHHRYDPVAGIGARPRGQTAPDDSVYDWRPV